MTDKETEVQFGHSREVTRWLTDESKCEPHSISSSSLCGLDVQVPNPPGRANVAISLTLSCLSFLISKMGTIMVPTQGWLVDCFVLVFCLD